MNPILTASHVSRRSMESQKRVVALAPVHSIQFKKRCTVAERESQLNLSCHILMSKKQSSEQRQSQLRYHIQRAIHVNQRLQDRLLTVLWFNIMWESRLFCNAWATGTVTTWIKSEWVITPFVRNSLTYKRSLGRWEQHQRLKPKVVPITI
jgi:hypothetical protein